MIDEWDFRSEKVIGVLVMYIDDWRLRSDVIGLLHVDSADAISTAVDARIRHTLG